MIGDSKDRKKGVTVCSYDSEKAADRVAHVFLFKVLWRMGFPDPFVKLLTKLYKGARSQVLVNKFFTNPFVILSRVRQGCPCLPFHLFD